MSEVKYVFPRHRSITHISRKNWAKGHSWFSSGNRDEFGTEFPGDAKLYGGHYFITSDLEITGQERAFTIRVGFPNGTVDTVGTYRELPTLAKAQEVIGLLLEAEEGGVIKGFADAPFPRVLVDEGAGEREITASELLSVVQRTSKGE